jgi:hypothetical protein
MEEHAWVKELPAEVMVCDETGIILEMNAEAKALFAKDGGDALLGLNVLGCHPEPSRSKLDDMLLRPSANAYFSTGKWCETLLLPGAIVPGWSVRRVR